MPTGIDPKAGRRYLSRVTFLLSSAILLFAGLTSPAHGQEEPVIERSEDPQARIDAAVSLYISGDLPGARAELIRLVNDPNLGEADLQQARVWLGEVEYVGGEREAARSTFRTVLLYDPSFRMDPFLHPPEVVSFFEATRAELSRVPDPMATLPPPRPTLSRTLAWVVPGGMQFTNGRPVLGVTTFAGVAALAGSTIPMRAWLLAQDEAPGSWGIGVSDETKAAQVRRVRTVQMSAGAAAGLLWLGAGVGGSLAVRGSGAPVALTVSPYGASLRVHF